MIEKLLKYTLVATMGVVLVSLLLGHALGYPVLLTFVETGSMEPTLNEGDGFIAVPAALTGDAEVGDVVVFEAEEIHGGEPTTHRIVDERQNGYITQGDDNPFTDQAGGEPPVTDGQIKAVALTVDGTVVRIPHVGTWGQAVGSVLDRGEREIAQLFGVQRLGSQQLALLLFGTGVIAFAAKLFIGEERNRSRERSRTGVFDSRWILAGCLLLICVGATFGMVAPAGTETYGIVSSEGDSDNPTVIPTGESDSFEFQIHNGGFLPTVSYFEPQSEGIEVSPDRVTMGINQTANATVTFHAPDETGYYLRSMTEHRYVVILPPSVIDTLYQIHPWAPYAAINGVVVAPLLILWYAFGGSSDTIRIRRRSRDRPTTLLAKLRNILR